MEDIDNFEYEYDPVKETVGGKAAERVVWSTKSILRAVDALKKGLPLKANPFIGKNTLLLKPDLVYKRTPEEVEDYIHCKQDPVYFGSKCYLKTTEGLQACKLRDYQEEYLRHLQVHPFSVFLAARQVGKCFLNNIRISILLKINYLDYFNKKQSKIIAKMLEKYYFYINNDYYVINNIPMFELLHIFEDDTLLNNIKYHLYKIIFKLEKWRDIKE